MRQLCEWFTAKEHRWAVTVAYRGATSTADVADAERWASAHGVTLLPDDVTFATLRSCTPTRFDIVVLGVWFYHASGRSIPELLLPHFAHHPRVLLLSDDVHNRRCLQQQQGEQQDCASVMARERELYTAQSVRAFIAVSAEDAAVFRAQFEVSRVVFLPMVVDRVARSVLRSRRASPTKRIVFVGTWHPANVAVVAWILDTLCPAMDGDPCLQSAAMFLVGARQWLSMWEQRSRASRTSVARVAAMVQPVADLDASSLLHNNTVFFAPNAFTGTGVATKVVLGLRHRVPVVTNRAGLQGVMHPDPRDVLRVAELSDVAGVKHALCDAFAALPLRDVAPDGVAGDASWELNAEWLRALGMRRRSRARE